MPKCRLKSHATAPDRSRPFREFWARILAGPKRNPSRHPEGSYCIRNTPLVPRARWHILQVVQVLLGFMQVSFCPIGFGGSMSLLLYQGSEVWAQVVLLIFNLVAYPAGLYVVWGVHISLLVLGTLILGGCAAGEALSPPSRQGA